MAGQYWQPASLSNSPVAYPGIPGVPTSYATSGLSNVASRPISFGAGGAKPNPFGIPANTWTGGAPTPYYQAPVTEGGWGQYDVDNQRRTNATNASAAAQNYNQYVRLRGLNGVAGGAALPGGGVSSVGGLGGGGYGGGGAGNGYLQNLIGQFQGAMNRANQANEARYQDINRGYQRRFETGADQLQGMGAQEARDINELYDKQRAQQNQNLIGRGLGNSTVQATMNAGNDRERAAELGRLNERVRQQSIGTMAGLSGDELGFMASKQESGPSYAMLAQLAQGLGTSGYGAPQSAGTNFGGVGGDYDTYGPGYQIPQFGFGANGGGWGGYGNNAAGYVAGSNRRPPPTIRRDPPLATGTNSAQLADQARANAWSGAYSAFDENGVNTGLVDINGNPVTLPAWAGAAPPDFAFGGNPTAAAGSTFAGSSLDDLARRYALYGGGGL